VRCVNVRREEGAPHDLTLVLKVSDLFGVHLLPLRSPRLEREREVSKKLQKK
jgi:hypothetical protein